LQVALKRCTRGKALSLDFATFGMFDGKRPAKSRDQPCRRPSIPMSPIWPSPVHCSPCTTRNTSSRICGCSMPMRKAPIGEVSRIVLHIDPDHDVQRARRAFDSHLARRQMDDGARISASASGRRLTQPMVNKALVPDEVERLCPMVSTIGLKVVSMKVIVFYPKGVRLLPPFQIKPTISFDGMNGSHARGPPLAVGTFSSSRLLIGTRVTRVPISHSAIGPCATWSCMRLLRWI
jgi:hypothetical protein